MTEDQEGICPFCKVTENRDVKMEKRVTSIGEDYWLCNSCTTAYSASKKQGEGLRWCFGNCKRTTMHRDNKCKVCGHVDKEESA